MKKLLVITFAMLFLGVGIASATDFSITGSYYARGTYNESTSGTVVEGAKDTSYGVYDHEMILDTNWQISPYTKVFARFEVRDEDWAVGTNATESSTGNTQESNIVNEYIYGQHTFGNGLTVRTGLMGTSSWATAFGNDGTEAYRVMFIKTTGIGQVIWFTEKPQGSYGETKNPDYDIDVYFLGLVTKANDITIMPSLVYVNYDVLNQEQIKFDLGVTGTLGNVGFESEFIYQDFSLDNGTDYDVFGAYLNVWTQMDALKLGAAIAYGSYDDDAHKGFEFNDDFECAGALLMGDESLMGGSDSIEAATLLVLYGSYAVNEKMTLSAYLGYADSNVDNAGTLYDGSSIYEINVQGSYKITDNVTYSAGAATSTLEYGNSVADPEDAVQIYHKLAFSF